MKFWTLTALCGLGLAFQVWMVSQQGPALLRGTLEGHNDFLQLYVGARLAGTGELYSLEANQRLQAELTGKVSPSIRYSRLPFYALLLRPLAALPYRAAYLTFQGLSLAALLVFVWLTVPECPLLAPLLCFSIPLTASFRQGQDLMFLLLVLVVYQLLARRGHGFAAGLVLSLGLIKFHLLVLLWLGLVIRKHWPEVKGMVTGMGLALALSLAAGGPHWIAGYLALLRDPALHPSPAIMPNLHGMTLGHTGIELGCAVVVVALFGIIALREPRRPMVEALALIGSLLVSRHAYIQDSVLMLAALAMLDKVDTSGPGKFLLLLFCTPLGALLQLTDPPVSVLPAAMLLLAYVMLVTAARPRPAPA